MQGRGERFATESIRAEVERLRGQLGEGDRVRELPDSLVNQIAAGEVIERPASAVKELVENALDAGASRVEVGIEAGGRALIEVGDDGSGMSRADAVRALLRHATSKLRSPEDLFAIRTLGFRGEALASIAEVSRLELETGQAGDLAGTRLAVDCGLLTELGDAPNPGGTRIRARNLFGNVPARLKFLKAKRTEVQHVVDAVQRQAMAHPEVGFRLTVDRRVVLDLPAHDELRPRVADLLGRAVARGLHPVLAESGELHLEGLVSDASLTRSSRAGLHFFVNGRYVKDRALIGAVLGIAGEALPRGRYPVVVLFLDLPPEQVDVNVHPAKVEVRFAEGRRIWDFVQGALVNTPLAGRERRDPDELGPLFEASRPRVDPAAQPSWVKPRGRPELHPGVVPTAAQPVPARPWTPGPALPGRGVPGRGAPGPMSEARGPLASPPRVQGAVPVADAPPMEASRGRGAAAEGGPSAEHGAGLLRMGEFAVVVHEEELLVVELTRLRARLLFERLRGGAESGLPARPLLVPTLLERPARVVQRLLDSGLLSRVGLHLSAFGPDTVAVHALPEGVPGTSAEAVVDAVAAWLADNPRVQDERRTEGLCAAIADAASPPRPECNDRDELLAAVARIVDPAGCVARRGAAELARWLR